MFFEKPSIKILGMIISQNKIQRIPLNFRRTRLAHSKCVKDIQSFLGFGNFYWRFIQGFANITHAHFLKPERHHVALDDDQQTAFETPSNDSLQTRFSLCQISRSHSLRDRCFGLQLWCNPITNNQRMVIGFQSPICPNRCFWQNALRQSMIRTSAIIEALKLWHHYLEGNPHPIEIWSITKSWILSFGAVLNRCQARWSLFLPVLGLLSPIVRYLNKADHPDTEVRSSGGGGIWYSDTTVLHPSIFALTPRDGDHQLQKRPYETQSKNRHAMIF